MFLREPYLELWNSSGGMWPGFFAFTFANICVRCVVFYAERKSFRKKITKKHQAIIFAISKDKEKNNAASKEKIMQRAKKKNHAASKEKKLCK